MRCTAWLIAFIGVLLSVFQPAEAKVRVSIDINTQTMAVTTDGGDSYVWPVSTGMSGFATPRGTFGIQRMMTMTYSNIYNNAPMPHAIFFSGGYAIHATYATGMLGRPASHGCIRLSPANAATLFALVRGEGAVISITGSRAPVYTASRHDGAKGKHFAAARTKHHKAVRVAKLHRAKAAGYLAYAPQAHGASLKAWMKHPTSSF